VWRDLAEGLAEEFGRGAGRGREWFDSEGYGFRRLPKLRDEAFEKKIKSLRATAWGKAHPERVAEYHRRYNATPEVKAKTRERKRRYREAARAKRLAELLTCEECGRKFRRKPMGPKPRFCRYACQMRHRYQRVTPGAKRCKRLPVGAVTHRNKKRS
jgi:hypothetical protein